ncbi:hypothetical protein [Paenibacillus sp. UMB4589-SE434]|uniref:hypothetical protein n=1 Tax=Paenibacillus sp. UMB4589-SE434 TaxID=3046314 RepID=UPI00254B750A|nr:hypothetical protein [Paenibacillus sp. UMB4589-SE434]MDK8182744.1 hypothetical protein [Paenibacillus sp. UMB4589-SE434]
MSMPKERYWVLVRERNGEALKHIGCVEAETIELAKQTSWRLYDEENWNEMVIVPVQHAYWVKQV